MDEENRQEWLRELARTKKESDKNWGLAVILSFLFGYLGVDRFYLGYVWSGVLKLVTFGGLGIWYMLDIILLVLGTLPDADGGQLRGPFRK